MEATGHHPKAWSLSEGLGSRVGGQVCGLGDGGAGQVAATA